MWLCFKFFSNISVKIRDLLFLGQRSICPQKNYLRKATAVKLSLENGDENGFYSFVLALDLLSAACNDQSS